MGLDVGEKTIGVAISDPLGLTAQGIVTLKRKNDFKLEVKELHGLVLDYEITQIVVGLPKNMDGSTGPQAQKAIKYAKMLKQALNLPVILWDERLSTLMVNRTLLEANVSRAGRKKVIDKLAATVLLQSFLDRESNFSGVVKTKPTTGNEN
jgi:putative Holliday junction resolvase